MDRLPPELCDHIVSYFPPKPKPRAHFVDPTAQDPREDPRPRLSALSTLSRRWQSSIERHLFRTLSITNHDLDNLDRVVTPLRRDHVRELRLTANFPDYDYELSKEYETNAERAANNAIATGAVRRLFAILGAWGAAGESPGLELHLGFTSPGDRVWEENGFRRYRGIDDKRYEYSFVRLDGVEEFAEVPRVTMLQQHGTRPVELCSSYGLTSRLPRATCALWDTVDAGPFARLQREQRDRFVCALESNPCRIPPVLHVTTVQPSSNLGAALPNLAAPHAYDRVSSAFRELSLGVTEFRFEGIADETLLWPSPAQARVAEPPYWENLTSLDIELALQSPLGKWYFLSEDGGVPSDVPIPEHIPGFLPPGYYDTEEESTEATEHAESLPGPEDDDGLVDMRAHFRTRPNDEIMVPLLAAFARAIGAMPSLRSAKLEFWNDGRYSPFYVAFAPPGKMAGDEDQLPQEERPPGTAPRLIAHTWEWRMGAELEDLFRRAWAAVHGVETAVRYLPELYGF